MKFFFAVTDDNLALQDRKTSREQRRVLFKKLTKRNAVLRGSAPHPATFEKVDETFRLLDASVGAVARKVSSFKVLRGCGGTFSKVPLRVPASLRPRVPAFPRPRVPASPAYSAYPAFLIVLGEIYD